jgi:hypothetical protein
MQRIQVAVAPPGPPSRRRLLLVGTDIGLTLTVLIVIAALASMLISYGDDAVMGAARASRFFSASRADVAPPQPQRVPLKETAFEHSLKHRQAGYYCPQHPEVISEIADTCPICGERLLWSDGSGAESGNLDKSATVVTGLNRIKAVPLFGAGWIERLVVKEIGTQVQRGELLMEVYAPEFHNDGIERQESIVRLYAPVAGTVRTIHAAEGKFVASGAVVMVIEDSSSLWLKSSLSSTEAAQVQAGQMAELLLPDAPGAAALGEVDEVVVNHDDATVWLRFDENPALRTQTEVNVRIHARAGEISRLEVAP